MPKSLSRGGRRGLVIAGAALLAATVLPACASDDDALVIYSGRNENLVRPILERFAEETGIDIEVRWGDTAELAATLLEEGDATKADVFFSQDAGALAALAARDLLADLDGKVLSLVPEAYRDPGGAWVGVTGRVRVLSYNTEAVRESELPESVFELTQPKWKDRVGFPPSNASFIAFTSAMIEQHGRDRTKAWLEGMKANGAKTYDNNIVAMEAAAEGEVDVALVNHYYLYNEFEQRPGSPVANFVPGQKPGGEGTFVNVAGLGILRRTSSSTDAERLVEYLLGEEAQEYFRDETAEYPLRAGVAALEGLTPLDRLRTIDVPLHRLGKDLEASLELLKEVGLT